MPEPNRPPRHPGDPGVPTSASFPRVLAAVFASFLGIRRRSAGEQDMARIKLAHVIIAALLGAAIFVAVLVTLVTFVTRRG
jgi:hypothetical protein